MPTLKQETTMRTSIIVVFILLLALQITQILVVSHFIRQLQTAVNRVTLTVEGREVSRSTRILLDQVQDNVIIVAGMNFPVTALEKFNTYWNRFTHRFSSMNALAEPLFNDPKLLNDLKGAILNSSKAKSAFEAAILNTDQGETYSLNIHDKAFEFDESMETFKGFLDITLEKFVEQETLAVTHEKSIHDLPIQAASLIGSLIGLILIALGIFAVFKIVNPLINLTIQYKITANRLKKEREISLALEKAQAAAQAKSEFLANMSHELRTPMNTVLGFSDLLYKSGLNTQQENYVQMILSSGQHLVELIDDILDFSKFEAGKLQLEMIDFDLRKMIDEVMDMTRIRIRGKALDLYIDYPTELPANIKSDPTRLKQVLVNLSNNAAKFTESGSIGILVSTNKDIECTDDELALRICIKDTGIGIPKNKVNKIFEEFTQADESITRKFGGTGLGLSISKSIVEAMGGRLWAESKSGEGSEFIFTVKFKKGEVQTKAEVDPEMIKKLKGKNAAIVDDNEISRKIHNELALSIGMNVLFMADSGKAALAKLDDFAKKKKFPDIIFCDIMMANMDGYEMAKKVRMNKKFNNTKIVAVTVNEEDGVAHKIKDYCFDTYLAKPISKNEMIQCLVKILGYSQSTLSDDEINISDDQFKGLRILVVEDTLLNQRLIQAIFAKLGCDVDLANNGKEALNKIEAREYDVCLMDLQMPIMGGIEATRIIREKINPNLAIIALTAAVTREDHKAAQEAGMNDFIEKPINSAELKKKVLKYSRSKKS